MLLHPQLTDRKSWKWCAAKRKYVMEMSHEDIDRMEFKLESCLTALCCFGSHTPGKGGEGPYLSSHPFSVPTRLDDASS